MSASESGGESSGDSWGPRMAKTELGEPPPRVVLYSRPGCHLCDEARAVVAQVCTDLGELYDEVDIDSSAELTRRYAEEIPVIFVDGEQHDFWRVEADRLRAALAGADGS